MNRRGIWIRTPARKSLNCSAPCAPRNKRPSSSPPTTPKSPPAPPECSNWWMGKSQEMEWWIDGLVDWWIDGLIARHFHVSRFTFHISHHMSQTFWENRYQTQDMPWEKGSPSPGLVDFLAG